MSTTHHRSSRLRRRALAAVVLSVVGTLSSALPAGALTPGSAVTYSASTVLPAPPASSFSGSSAGDGWAVALNDTQVFNVFHHQSTLPVDCHVQTTAASCWGAPSVIVDGSGDDFATSNAPGLYLDQADGDLYVFAVRTSDHTAGVVCVDTALGAGATGAQRFCGFTALSAVGGSPISLSAGVSDPVQVGTDWYSFNEVPGTPTGSEDELLCFDLATFAACPSQPYAMGYGSLAISPFLSAPPIGAVGSDVYAQIVGSTSELTCFSTTTHARCSGTWPVRLAASGGAPFPILSTTGSPVGVCVPITHDPCFSATGAPVATPVGLAAQVGDTVADNGPSLVLGTRVYIPNATLSQVNCYDFSVDETCTAYPKILQNLTYVYTVTPDPQRPDCLWIDSDHGSAQIQSFDAYTGGPCKAGVLRVLSSALVAPGTACLPTNYGSFTVTTPAPGTYTSATLEFENSNAQPLAGIPTQTLNAAGSVDLAPLNLTTAAPLPQFVLTFANPGTLPAEVHLTLTWSGTYEAACTSGGQTVTGGGPPPGGSGYWLVAADGGIFSYGHTQFYGSTGNLHLNKPIVGMAPAPSNDGYWMVASDGGIFTFGPGAHYFGSTGGQPLKAPVVAMVPTPDGQGYWLAGANGAVYNFGDAKSYGSAAKLTLNSPIVGIAPTSDGKGYWLVAADGGIFSYGDAVFYGSAGNLHLNKPIVGMATTPDGRGYWFVAADGGVFSYGDAVFHGSAGNLHLNQPVVGMAATPDGLGYWMVASDGGIFSYGDAVFYGSAGNLHLNQPIVGMAT
jgi:hypothetical protein